MPVKLAAGDATLPDGELRCASTSPNPELGQCWKQMGHADDHRYETLATHPLERLELEVQYLHRRVADLEKKTSDDPEYFGWKFIPKQGDRFGVPRHPKIGADPTDTRVDVPVHVLLDRLEEAIVANASQFASLLMKRMDL